MEDDYNININLYYSYNDKNQLIGITGNNPSSSNPVNIVLSYDEQDRLVHVQNSEISSWTYTYNDNNQLDKQLETMVNADGSTRERYYKSIYNSAGDLAETRLYLMRNNVEEQGPSYKYTYTDGQVSRLEVLQPTGEMYKDYTFSYDDKKAPLAGLPLYAVPRFVVSDFPGQHLMTQNFSTFTLLNEKGQRTNMSCFAATYSYNEAGYPTESTRTYDNGYVEHTVYTYITK
ncbi:hypothetical protein [Pontibacter pudoricolor]|uniref:hypothetical protein n=1 Tax=Pontibacter pudoricolor TaxID=2694930 RepID=UPI0013913FAA|nr:hypothetical protein [Pontibacter pudoricolor]